MEIIREMTTEYEEYLRDESRLRGTADSIAFPKTEEEVVALVKHCAALGKPINVQGARTGLGGGAVPQGGLILNLSRMNKILGMRYDAETDTYYLRVQAGILLSQVRKALETKNFNINGWSQESIDVLREIKAGELFFSPDPTESTATIGGMAACNASGARSVLYGSTRRHIHGIRAVLADGSITELRRNLHTAQGRSFTLPLEGGGSLQGQLPSFNTPEVKDAGFYIRENMDLADLFMGSQGTVGIITELELTLMPAPKLMWGATTFLPDDQSALKFIRLLRGEKLEGYPEFKNKPASLEFFDRHAMDLFLHFRAITAAFQGLQAPKAGFDYAVYVEFNEQDPKRFRPVLEELIELVRAVGGDPDHTWVARNVRELEQLLFFRHAVSESSMMACDENRKNEPSIQMLSADMATPGDHLEIYDVYKKDLEESGLQWIIFGHAGENHFHPNILPRTKEEMEQGHEIFEKWAEIIHNMGGTITAEHGAGKIKKNLASIMYGAEKLQALKNFKMQLDPQGILGPGNLFD